METATSQVFIWAFQSLPQKEQMTVLKWMKEHENEIDDKIQEKKDFENLAVLNFNNAFGENELEYNLNDCIELNPKFKP